MKPSRSRKEQRQDNILSALEANPALRVNQLAEELDVSTETIRRDLAELDQAGRLSRTYGGAIVAQNRFEPLLNDRINLNVAERQAIATRALEEVAGEEALLLGGGATMLQFARVLRNIARRITVITPAYPIALELSSNPLIEIVLLPGGFEPQERMVCGPETIRAVERYRAPVVLIGASGVSVDGISEAMLGVGEVYSAMLASAGRSYVLADHSKFEKRALVLLDRWHDGLSLITDREPAAELSAALRRNGSGLLLPD
ncbi:DeoR/GlpR family DNA-binding transcription regulator [Rhodobacter sp. 24-YEA-8]|uniref:DeoR/GlpR family DNA-binding transcription regulator n=1 Tax=Rhodobacter sp. 24-YEA-8 TaxID=1884310 RepID=UPI00089C5A79|nr:DeoR/GlpR family DNA-binding transcription regulator [Rhodobacter sp. 24-YEA-8]SED66130.1 transcriptional regulator, DeoR family [Rhodobacter sp. 24-YEA-8]